MKPTKKSSLAQQLQQGAQKQLEFYRTSLLEIFPSATQRKTIQPTLKPSTSAPTWRFRNLALKERPKQDRPTSLQGEPSNPTRPSNPSDPILFNSTTSWASPTRGIGLVAKATHKSTSKSHEIHQSLNRYENKTPSIHPFFDRPFFTNRLGLPKKPENDSSNSCPSRDEPGTPSLIPARFRKTQSNCYRNSSLAPKARTKNCIIALISGAHCPPIELLSPADFPKTERHFKNGLLLRI